MNGWLAVARISCSANARLIFFRIIISFFESTKGSEKKERSQEVGSDDVQKGRVTFHSEQLVRLLLPHQVHPPDISSTQ